MRNRLQVGLIGTFLIIPMFLVVGMISGCRSSLLLSGNSLTKATPAKLALPATDVPAPSLTSPIKSSATPPSEEGKGDSHGMISITVVYDNYPHEPGLKTAWGFAAVVEVGGQQLLFDTGGSGGLLLANLEALDIQPAEIETVVLSHEHNDHTGGLPALLAAGADPVIYIPPSFSASFKDTYSSRVRLVESQSGMEIGNRLYTTGELPGPPPEQALVIDTTKGLVVITGCAHPGVDRIILEAKRQYQEDIYLVLGGFHLGNASDARINQIIREFQRLGVQYAAPCHCTGDHAIGLFRNSLGDGFISVGVGAVIEIDL